VRLIASGVLTGKEACKDGLTQNVPPRIGELTKDFVTRFIEVRGDDFTFFGPSHAKTVGGQEYYVVGSANEKATAYLLQPDSDLVLVYDEEDGRIDSKLKFPSVWHALLFEAKTL
jgi:hypothetical protein